MSNYKICIVGQGYVGLALSVACGSIFSTIGFDNNSSRIDDLKNSIDKNKQINKKNLKNSHVYFTSKINEIKNSNIYILCLPTPIKKNKEPNISILKNATIKIAKILKKNDLIIYESTVYPGLTEEICIPIIEKYSNLKKDKEFNVGYSPERINPGDKINTISNIKKVISARNKKTLNTMYFIYNKIIKAGVFKAENIKTAEAAKVIENSQRDINIAFMNELSLIFDRMKINTNAVLKAASTKWNFLNFKPGLVGGHCIGVDPYYLTYKSKQLGYEPKIILAGREINESIDKLIIKKIYDYKKKNNLKKINCIFLGVTFKENCPDFRNSKSVNIIKKLSINQDIKLQINDPLVNKIDFENAHNIKLTPFSQLTQSNILIISVNHKAYKKITNKKWENLIHSFGLFIDIKSLIDIKKFKNTKNIIFNQL